MIKVCVTGYHVFVSENGGVDWFALGIINLGDAFRGFPKEPCVVEFMPTVFRAIEREAAVAQRQLPVFLPCRDDVGQHAAHRIFARVVKDALAEIHHTAAFRKDPSSAFGKESDGFPGRHIFGQCIEVLFRITA